jgi:flotillin
VSALAVAIVLGVLLVATVAAIITVFRNLYVCSPSEVLIFSGRTWPVPGDSGRVVGFRVVRGGRAMRVPFIEVVDRMQLTNMSIELSVTSAFSRGGVPLNVQAIANIKIPSEEPLLHNALERFLGCTQAQIVYVAKDTLEGNLRGVIAEMTPEEINQKKVIFQQKLIEEADRDLQRLGLVLDNLQIQNIGDDVGYLASVGRVRGAAVRRDAKIGEIKARASAVVQKAQNVMAAEISKIEADLMVARKENERRIVEATTQREAVISEVRGVVRGQVAEARAQLLAWDAAVEQTRRRLEADVIAPAEAGKQQAEASAKGQASQIVANGAAFAEALTALAEAYKATGGRAREALLLQKLVPIFEHLTGTIQSTHITRLTVLPSGSSLGTSVLSLNEQVRASTGVDLVAAVRDRTTP